MGDRLISGLKRNPAILILIAVLLLASFSCAGRGAPETMELSAGQDYIGDRGGSGAVTYGEEMMSEPDWDRPSGGMKRAASPAAPMDAETPAANGSPGGVSIVDSALEESGLLEQLDNWMLPRAYAEDHELDERYLVREGDCKLEVDDYRKAADEVMAIARLYDGMVSDSHSSKRGDDTTEGWIKLRVPGEKFFEAWADVKEVGEVYEENIMTQDVSQQYVGYVSRLKNLMAEQATLQKMLEEALAVQRSRGLGEGYSILLDTQERLFNVTAEIESTEDRMNALADRITRSTITVHLTEVKALPEQVKEEFTWGFGTTAGTAYKDLLKALRGAGQGFIYFIITCWTWLIPWAIVILIGRWIYLKWVKPWIARERAKADSVMKPRPE